MKIKNFLLLISLTIYALSCHQLRQLPDPDVARPELFREPIQREILENEFNFNYRGTAYKVKPVADYEIWGMITSHNNIKAWYNFYHDEDSVNFKDVCLVWGENVETGVYQDVKFTSGEWTCYVNPKRKKIMKKLHLNQVSNNHLLTDDEKVLETIQNMKKGDQIHLRGKLVNYAESSRTDNRYRSTSLTRNDRGCEIIFVEEARILRKGKHGWYFIQHISKCIILLLIAIRTIIFIKNIIKPSFKIYKM